MTLLAKDLSPIHGIKPGDDNDRFLTAVQEHVRVSEHVIRLGETRGDDEDWVVRRDAYGTWEAGRYIGEIALGNRRLEIAPRYGPDVIGSWLEGALNLVAVPETSAQPYTESFIALLMAAVWCRAFDVAARHGPPTLRRDQRYEGYFVRGHLDVRETARLRGRGAPHIASVMRRKDAENDVSRTLVAAERFLRRTIGHDRWQTPRVRELMPHLYDAVGTRPSLPSLQELNRVRYTPITRPFRTLTELSWRIARREGFGASAEPGHAEGLLLDVAELWELFLLSCAREAAPHLRVTHGTTETEKTFLLESQARDVRGLGRLKPDILIGDDQGILVVADAKYKRLVDNRPERPDGVERADLYQLMSYLTRWDPAGQALGLLLYPLDPNQTQRARAETDGPWSRQPAGPVEFVRVPLWRSEAVKYLSALVHDRTRGVATAALVTSPS